MYTDTQMIPIFKTYNHSKEIQFILIGEIAVEAYPYELTYDVIYIPKVNSISCMLKMQQVFDIVGHINERELGFGLLECFENNLGYSKEFMDRFSKWHKPCKDQLQRYLSELIQNHWTIQDMKNNQHVEFIESMLNDVLFKEAEMRYKSKHASKIQKQWRNSIANPEYSLCRKRLLSEFTTFT